MSSKRKYYKWKFCSNDTHTCIRIYYVVKYFKKILFLLWDFVSDVQHSAQCLEDRNSQHKVDIDVIINYFKKHLIFLFELLKI